ncbi:MAG: hypothetical protein IIA66_12095 [Planctomycetes bacterium]|nr:hypothetical protein [Planctomycetota bacterium]
MLVPLLILTTGGMCLALASCPLTKMPWQFVRMICVIALATATTAAVWLVHQHMQGTPRQSLAVDVATIASAILALTALSMSPLLHSRRYKVSGLVRSLLGLCGAAGIVAGLLWAEPTSTASAPAPSAAISHLLGGLLLGSVTVAWLLGHRYLTASEMTIDPLKRASQLLFVALGARWGFLLVMLSVGALASGVADSAGAFSTRLASSWMPLSMRIGIGLVLPTVFAYMVWQCVRLRSTQSATGILFFMSLFVAVGELTSRYLINSMGGAL